MPSQLLTAQFEVSAAAYRQCPTADQPEVAFAGRSNAGKSSVLNRLAGARSLARVSRTPGRTQLLNFFQVQSGGRLVDLPGYGYAAVARRQRDRWQIEIDRYLSERPTLQGLVLVTDIRHPLKPTDQVLVDWAAQSGVPLLMLLNKADKLSYSARLAALTRMTSALSAHPNVTIALFSATTGLGLDDVTAVVRAWLDGTSEEAQDDNAEGKKTPDRHEGE